LGSKNKANLLSFSVLRDAYCEKDFEKTKPIIERLNERKYLYERVLWGISWFWAV